MRRVKRQRQINFIARNFPSRRIAHMVFHITRLSHAPWNPRRAFKFSNHLVIWLTHNTSQRIQATSMRHANHNFFDATFCRSINNFLHRIYRRVTAFNRESLRARKSFMQELFEFFGANNFAQDFLFLIIA